MVSHTIKYASPDSRVIYNDYNHYGERLNHIGRTNKMLQALRPILAEVPPKVRIEGATRKEVVAEVERWNKSGYVDWFTISSNLHFTMNYSHNFEEFRKESLYNRVRLADYDADGYLEGVETVSMDYRELFERYRNEPNVIFVLDPPYLSTDCGTYQNNYWRLSDYLDILKCLRGTRFIYFTSSKSNIIELAEWLGKNDFHENPFDGAKETRCHVSGQALNYDDIMIIKTD